MIKLIEDAHESSSKDSIFKIGDRLNYSMLYGDSVDAKVIDRSSDKLTLREYWVAEDTWETVSKDTEYTIYKDDNGVEYIVVWEYKGHKGMVYPPNFS